MERTASQRWLTYLLIPATAALVVSALSLHRHAYVGMSLRPDGLIGNVEADGPAARAGLRDGDRPIHPGGRREALASDPLSRATPGHPLVIERERAGRRATVWLAPEALPESERRFNAIMFAVASSFLLLGGWVWSERRDRLTTVFFLLCLAFAVWLVPTPRLESTAWNASYEFLMIVVQAFVGPLFSHFFALFPEPLSRPRARLWVRALYASAALITLAYVVVEADLAWGAGRTAALLATLQAALSVLLALGMLAGLMLFAGAFTRSMSRDARRRLRVAFFGTLAGAAPFALLVALRNLAPGVPVPGERWAVPFTLLVPGSFAWAIAVHRVFDFRVALRAVVAVIVAGLLGLGVYVAGEQLAASWWPAWGEQVTGVSLACLAVLAALAGPARPWLGALGARVVPIADETSLAAWAPSAEAVREGEVAVLDEACAAVVGALRLDGCAAARIGDGRPRLAANAGSPLVPRLGAGFAEALGRARGPREVEGADLAPEDRDALEVAGVHWLLPITGAAPVGALLLGRRLAGAWLDRHEARDLARFADHLAVALENADLRREAKSRGAMDREMAEAHHIQVRRLPRRTPVYPSLDCAAATLSIELVGGDYYDFVEGGPRDFTLAVGDAAGHGVPAALVLAGVQARFRDEAQRARHAGELLEALNRDLVALEQPEKFMGLLCARVDASSGTLRFANAGLTPPVLRRADGHCEEITESGTLLGVSAGARYDLATVEMRPGDLVVVYTDGLTEAARRGQPFGFEGLERVLAVHGHRRAADVLEELLTAVRAWTDEPLDDLTIVVLKQLAVPRGAGEAPKIELKGAAETADARR